MNDDILNDKGRKPDPETMAQRTTVLRHLREMKKDDEFTVPELSDKLDLSAYHLRKVLRFFEKKGIVATQIGKKQTSLDGGRPATLWKIL